MSRFRFSLALWAAVFIQGAMANGQSSPTPPANTLVVASVDALFSNFLKIIKVGPSFNFNVSAQFGKNKPAVTKVADFKVEALLQELMLPLVTSAAVTSAFTDFNLDVKADGVYFLGKAKTMTEKSGASYLAVRFGFYKDADFSQKTSLIWAVKSKDLKLITIHLDSLSGVVRGLDDPTASVIQANAKCDAQQELLSLKTLEVTPHHSICLAEFTYTKATGDWAGAYKYSSSSKGD